MTKYCPVCRKDIALEYNFCPSCGTKPAVLSDPESGTGNLNVGDENVIAGDIIGQKHDYSISGDATFIRNVDETKKIRECHICGKQCVPTDGYICRKCGRFTCTEHYHKGYRCCLECAEEVEIDVGASVLTEMDAALIDHTRHTFHTTKSVEAWPQIRRLFEKTPGNTDIRRLYYNFALDFDTQGIPDSYEVSPRNSEELEATVEAMTRLQKFGDAAKIVGSVIFQDNNLTGRAAWAQVGLYVDLYLYSGNTTNLSRAQIAKESADNFEIDTWTMEFFREYLTWSEGKSGIRSLAVRLSDTSNRSGDILYRKRRTLMEILPSTEIWRLKVADLEISSRNLTVPLYFSTVLGRDQGLLHLELADDDACSRLHARLEVQSDLGVLITDAGSTNGTSVNGAMLPAGVEKILHDGDTIGIGDTNIIFRIPEAVH